MLLIHTRTPGQPKIYCENIRPLKITLARRSPGAPGPRRVSNLTPRDILPWFQLHSDSNFTSRDIFPRVQFHSDSNLTPRDIFPQFQLHSNSNFTPRDIFLDLIPLPLLIKLSSLPDDLFICKFFIICFASFLIWITSETKVLLSEILEKGK